MRLQTFVTEVECMPHLSVMIKPSSGMCNMSCDYCFYCDETQKRKQESYGFMSEQTLKNVIRRTLLRAEGAIGFAYQGGEPTLRGLPFFEQALLYQRQYNKRNVRVTNAIQTNGFGLNEEWCRFFAENHFLVGISVDGTKALHDLHRHDRAGQPTYDRIMQSVALLERFGVDYNILTVVNRDVAEHIEEIYEEYRKKGWMFQQYIACLDPLEEGHGVTEYSLTPKQYGTFLKKLFDMWYADWEKGRQPYIRRFENYIGILAGYPPESCEQCGICGNQYVVEADGSVYPCDFYMLDEYRLGNLNEDLLDAIDEKRKEIGFVERSRKLSEACKSCEYYGICRGGCQRNRDYQAQTDTYHNYFCEGYREFFKYSLERMKKIADTIGG